MKDAEQVRADMEASLKAWADEGNVIGRDVRTDAAAAVRRLMESKGYEDVVVEPDRDDITALRVSYRPQWIEVTVKIK